MKYFNYLDNKLKSKLFYRMPEEFNKNSNNNTLRYCIGPLLYIPAIDKKKLYKFFDGGIEDGVSVVMCLEDSVGENGEEEGISNIKEVLEYVKNKNDLKDNLPLIFIRPKNLDQMVRIGDSILKNNLNLLTGIVIPKANGEIINSYIEKLKEMKCDNLYIMPIIETIEFIQVDTKEKAFENLLQIVNKYHNKILNIRIGVTDILGSYRLRRNKNYTIYDNMIFYTFASDLLSSLGGKRNDFMVISGGVSEFYDMKKDEILNSYIREIEIDKLNGFVGKTVIHPQQMKVFLAMSIVTYEDYMDAICILENVHSKFGVSAGLNKERMNEVNPHLNWAKKILMLSKVYGVLNEGRDFNELLRF